MPYEVTFHCSHCSTPMPEDDVGYYEDDKGNFVCIDCFNQEFKDEYYDLNIQQALILLIDEIKDGNDNHSAIVKVVNNYGLNTHQVSMVIKQYNEIQQALHVTKNMS